MTTSSWLKTRVMARAITFTLERELGRYHLILNPDVELPPTWLTDAIDFLDANQQVVLYATRGMNDRGR